MRFSSSLALVCKSGRESFNATPLSRTNIAGKDIRNAPLTSHIIMGIVSISLTTVKSRVKVYAIACRKSNIFSSERTCYYAYKVVATLDLFGFSILSKRCVIGKAQKDLCMRGRVL